MAGADNPVPRLHQTHVALLLCPLSHALPSARGSLCHVLDPSAPYAGLLRCFAASFKVDAKKSYADRPLGTPFAPSPVRQRGPYPCPTPQAITLTGRRLLSHTCNEGNPEALPRRLSTTVPPKPLGSPV